MTNPAKTPDPIKGPFVVVPIPGTQGLAVALGRGVRDEFGREFMGGTTYGFEEKSAVSLLLAGYGSAYCFDEAAAERWMKALRSTPGAMEKIAPKPEGEPTLEDAMDLVLRRFSGPFIELARAAKQAHFAQLAEDDRKRAEEAETAAAKAAQEKLEADQLAAEAAEKQRLMDEAAKSGNLAVSLVDQPPALASDATQDGEAVREPAPATAKPEPAQPSKRGDKSPRGK